MNTQPIEHVHPGERPLVSLLIPVYNGMPYLTETLKACIEQDYGNIEIIITDNASTDETAVVCEGLARIDARVRYVRNEANLGAAANFNLGFELSRGKYLKWCAADDLFSPNFVSACVSVLEGRPEVVLAYGSSRSIDERGRDIPLVGRGMKEHLPGDGSVRRFHKDLYDRATNFEVFGVFRRSALAETTLHRPYYGSDVTLVTELTLLGRFELVPGAVLYNRDHPERSIRLGDRHLQHLWQDTRATRKPRRLNVERFFHLVEIAVRHRGRIPFLQVAAVIALWTSRTANATLALMLKRLVSLPFSGARS